MLGKRIWELSRRPQELLEFAASRSLEEQKAIRYVEAYFAKRHQETPTLAFSRRQMYEQLPAQFYVTNMSPEEYVSMLKKAYYLGQEPLDQLVLNFLFDTSQLDLVFSEHFCSWIKLHDYNLRDLLCRHYFRGNLPQLLVRARLLEEKAPLVKKHFGMTVTDSLRSLYNEQAVAEYCEQLFTNFEAIERGEHPFERALSEFKGLESFLRGGNSFLFYVGPPVPQNLDGAEQLQPVNFAHLLAWIFDYQFPPPYSEADNLFSNFISGDYRFLEDEGVDPLLSYIKSAKFPERVSFCVKRILVYAFSRCNGQNIKMYIHTFAEFHQQCFLHAASFYATKIFLTDLGDMIFDILKENCEHSPLMARAFVVFVLRELDYECFAKGRIQKSIENAVVFAIKVCHEFDFPDLMQYMAVLFEKKATKHEILAVFGLREIVFRLMGLTQRKSVDSVQINTDLCLESTGTSFFESIQLQNPAKLILSLNHRAFEKYYKESNCIVDELSDMITLLRNDLLYIYKEHQFVLDLQLDFVNELNTLILPNCWEQRAEFDRSMVLYFGQVYRLTEYYPNTILDAANISLISTFIYESPRQYHELIAQFMYYHLENGRKREVCDIVRNVIMNSLTWTKNDADRIGDFFVHLFKLFGASDMLRVVLQILTYYMMRYSAGINAVEALYLALKFERINQFREYFTLIKRIVVELYTDIDDAESVFLRYITQEISKSEVDEQWDGKIVECYVLKSKEIEEEFLKWAT